MSISLSSIALAITNLTSVASAAAVLYTYASDLMEATEKAYESTSGTGSSKKAAVMAAVKALADALGLGWSTFESAVSAFIDSVKNAYNALKAMAAATPTAA